MCGGNGKFVGRFPFAYTIGGLFLAIVRLSLYESECMFTNQNVKIVEQELEGVQCMGPTIIHGGFGRAACV